MMAVAVDLGPPFVHQAPRPLFDDTYLRDPSNAAAYPFYDVALDGRSFIMLRPEGGEGRVVVVLDWATELRATLGLD